MSGAWKTAPPWPYPTRATLSGSRLQIAGTEKSRSALKRGAERLDVGQDLVRGGGGRGWSSAGARRSELGASRCPWFWYLSRAAGVSAYLALALSVMWGLLLSTRLVDTLIARSVELHKWISAVALALVAAHALVLIGHPYVRFDMLGVLLPFASAYRPAAIALGVLSAYGSVVVFGSFWLRRQIGQRTWRIVHILAFPTFVAVTLHGMLAGTDSGTAWMRSAYLLASAVLIWLMAYRVISRLSARRSGELQTVARTRLPAAELARSQAIQSRPAVRPARARLPRSLCRLLNSADHLVVNLADARLSALRHVRAELSHSSA